CTVGGFRFSAQAHDRLQRARLRPRSLALSAHGATVGTSLSGSIGPKYPRGVVGGALVGIEPREINPIRVVLKGRSRNRPSCDERKPGNRVNGADVVQIVPA